jgi:HPt (histidine-containing phosphotransfer) domain-containing protein
VTEEIGDIVEWPTYQRARSELGGDFVRILAYFREDGIKSVAAIEAAMRAGDAVALVIPAHTLKGEARQFGAMRLAGLAELIEMTARRSIEDHQAPDELITEVVKLRPLFVQTLELCEQEANPPALRRAAGSGFGRKVQAL